MAEEAELETGDQGGGGGVMGPRRYWEWVSVESDYLRDRA